MTAVSEAYRERFREEGRHAARLHDAVRAAGLSRLAYDGLWRRHNGDPIRMANEIEAGEL